jgi:hypothetical protein
LGIVRYQVGLERGFRFLTFRGCFWFAVGFARAVSLYTRAAVAVVHPGLPRRLGRPPSSSYLSSHHPSTDISPRRFVVVSLRLGLP